MVGGHSTSCSSSEATKDSAAVRTQQDERADEPINDRRMHSGGERAQLVHGEPHGRALPLSLDLNASTAQSRRHSARRCSRTHSRQSPSAIRSLCFDAHVSL
jgi:hypothetical protein